MEFAELRKTIEKDMKLEKPEFIKDTETNFGIGHIELTATQKLIFAIQDFRGKKYFDIRTWYQDDSGEWKPTKKGVHFSFDKFADFEAVFATFSQINKLEK